MSKLLLTKKEVEFVIDQLQNGQQLPDDLQYKLFPVKQKEYELVYGGKMRKEDILANEDGVSPVPLQVEKVFNGDGKGWNDNWRNMIVFGDNLQFLKTCYENKDPLIKNKIKGNVKLIYIDPPFGTGDEYEGNKGQTGYTAKSQGAEFVEFIRRRIIVAKEILSNDGFIIVRQAYNFGFEIKIILDEVFNKNNFRNEIIINKANKQGAIDKRFNPSTEFLFLYSKAHDSQINPLFKIRSKEVSWLDMHSPKENKYSHSINFHKRKFVAPKGRHWTFSQDRLNDLIKEQRIRVIDKNYVDVYGNKQKMILQYLMDNRETIESNWTDIPGYSFLTKYPTENSEPLLERVIKTATKEGDIVLDFFAGSGTTSSVAEKINRKWIVCDIGKLAFYTMQKRMLHIHKSKSIENPKKKYNKHSKTFITVNTGWYDLEKVFNLRQEKYCNFVMELFEVESFKNKKISGISIDGQKKDGFYCIIYPYWQFKNSSVDEEYLDDLHAHLGKKIGSRLYIIAPNNYVDFSFSYHEINNVRYYFLKVPYQIIKELHKKDFKKFRQPQSKGNVNDLEDAVGFHFMRQPQVKSAIKVNKDKVEIHIKEFYSDFTEEESGNDMENFESLAMVLIDKNFNDTAFELDDYYFAEDLLPKKKKSTEYEDNLKEELKKQKEIVINLSKNECGKKFMLVYVDIYGNEFKEKMILQ